MERLETEKLKARVAELERETRDRSTKEALLQKQLEEQKGAGNWGEAAKSKIESLKAAAAAVKPVVSAPSGFTGGFSFGAVKKPEEPLETRKSLRIRLQSHRLQNHLRLVSVKLKMKRRHLPSTLVATATTNKSETSTGFKGFTFGAPKESGVRGEKAAEESTKTVTFPSFTSSTASSSTAPAFIPPPKPPAHSPVSVSARLNQLPRKTWTLRHLLSNQPVSASLFGGGAEIKESKAEEEKDKVEPETTKSGLNENGISAFKRTSTDTDKRSLVHHLLLRLNVRQRNLKHLQHQLSVLELRNRLHQQLYQLLISAVKQQFQISMRQLQAQCIQFRSSTNVTEPVKSTFGFSAPSTATSAFNFGSLYYTQLVLQLVLQLVIQAVIYLVVLVIIHN